MKASAEEGPVDEEMLAELFIVMEEGSLDGLTAICDLFLTGVPARLSEIEAALQEARLDDAAKAAHSLKGTGGAFGARALGALAGRLERACREMDGASTPALLEDLHREFLVFRNILQERLAYLRHPPEMTFDESLRTPQPSGGRPPRHRPGGTADVLPG